MMLRYKILLTVCVVGLSAVGLEAVSRPDYYTAGFYTRGASSAAYMDQGGVLDPFYIPMKKWSFLPRVTVMLSGNDNYFMNQEDDQTTTSVRLIPGATLIYGRPDHNHLYADVSASLPLGSGSANSGKEYVVTAGGVYKTGRTQISGRLGHRQMSSANTAVGNTVPSILCRWVKVYIASIAKGVKSLRIRRAR